MLQGTEYVDRIVYDSKDWNRQEKRPTRNVAPVGTFDDRLAPQRVGQGENWYGKMNRFRRDNNSNNNSNNNNSIQNGSWRPPMQIDNKPWMVQQQTWTPGAWRPPANATPTIPMILPPPPARTPAPSLIGSDSNLPWRPPSNWTSSSVSNETPTTTQVEPDDKTREKKDKKDKKEKKEKKDKKDKKEKKDKRKRSQSPESDSKSRSRRRKRSRSRGKHH